MNNMNNHSDNDFIVLNRKRNKKISILAFIGCFLLACIVWVYVMNTEISDNSKTFIIKMDIRGETDLLNDKNFSVFTASETFVKVTVQGSVADLNKCSEKDFDVSIDVSTIENSGMTPLNIAVVCNSRAVSVVSTDPVQMTVFADEKVNDKEVPVFVRLGDEISLKDNEQIRPSKGTISVSGPKTYLEKIDHAYITVTTLDFRGGDEKGAYNVVFPVKFFDVAENEISSPYLNYNAYDISLIIEDVSSPISVVSETEE